MPNLIINLSYGLSQLKVGREETTTSWGKDKGAVLPRFETAEGKGRQRLAFLKKKRTCPCRQYLIGRRGQKRGKGQYLKLLATRTSKRVVRGNNNQSSEGGVGGEKEPSSPVYFSELVRSNAEQATRKKRKLRSNGNHPIRITNGEPEVVPA